MNRQQKRKIEREIQKLSPEALEYMTVDNISHTLRIVKKALHDEFGFGDKRIARLEAAMHKVIKEDKENANSWWCTKSYCNT